MHGVWAGAVCVQLKTDGATSRQAAADVAHRQTDRQTCPNPSRRAMLEVTEVTARGLENG
jgi:hypothetical protein